MGLIGPRSIDFVQSWTTFMAAPSLSKDRHCQESVLIVKIIEQAWLKLNAPRRENDGFCPSVLWWYWLNKETLL